MLLPLPGFAATAPAPATPQAEALGSVATGDAYADNVNFALQQNPDHWGEMLLAGRDGPTFDNIKPLLTPANIASQYVTESGWYYLPFTDRIYDPATWLQDRDFAIHVADGSQITSQYCWASFTDQRQWVDFQVGAGHEVYGSAIDRLAEPTLWGGYQPVLGNSYTDAAGTRWDRESFATRVAQSASLISFVHFTVQRGTGPATTTLRLYLHVEEAANIVSDGKRLKVTGNYYLLSGTAGSWNEPDFDIPVDLSTGSADIYLAILNTPAPATGLTMNAATYQRAKQATATYWTNALSAGANVSVPEPYAMDAMRNLLLQNLVMSWQQSIANGYETGDPSYAFVPEVSTSVAALGDFGFLDSYRDGLKQILIKGQGPDTFPNWEKGIRLQSAAAYFRLSNDSDYILENLTTFQGYLADFTAQRAADPNGLLEKQRYGSDIPQPVYGIHHQSEAWRGMRDLGLVLQQLGNSAAAPFLSEAAAHRTALLAAIGKSSQSLPDGALYVPISLLDPTAPPAYPQITATRDGSYWNLTMPYALSTGIFPAGSAQAKGVLRYILQYGGMFAGLLRFNESGINPPGVYESGPTPPFPAAPAGYETPGVDEQYLYSLLNVFNDNDERDRLTLAFYGKLAQDLTPNTFIGGEGTTISPASERPAHLRSQWYPPLSANNAVYLHTLREMLVHEDLDADGVPSVLHITPATPRGWLAPGKQIVIKGLPTYFGPVDFSLTATPGSGSVTAKITPPVFAAGRLRPTDIVLHVHTPGGESTQSLGALSGPKTVVVTPRSTQAGGDQARPTVVTPARLLFQAGDTIPLKVTVEALGAGTVSGTLSVRGPAGWPTPSAAFGVASSGHIGWQMVTTTLTIPADAQPGVHPLTLTASPGGGKAVSRTLDVEVAVPAGGSYPALVQASSPAGYWRLGEASGTSAADSSGHGGAGTYQGTVTLGQAGAITDDPNGAVRLVNGYIEVPDSPAVSFTGPFTLEAWIKVISADQMGIIEKYTTPANDGYVLRTVQANKLFAQTLTLGALPPGITGPTTVLPPLWHHVAAVYDGSNLTIYLDGAVETTTTNVPPPADGPASLKLGGRGDDGSERLNGWLDEVAVYPSALTAAQVKSHYVKGVLGNLRQANPQP